MPRYITKEEAFEKCKIEGKLIPQEEVNIEKIKSIVEIAKSDLKSAQDLKKSLSKDSNQWSSVYKLSYDALHELVEACLCFDKIKSNNHQCLFAYLCEKHPELELNWDFFEKIRTKRNGINYYGTPVTEKDWKEIEIQLKLYIKILKETIERKINEFDK